MSRGNPPPPGFARLIGASAGEAVGVVKLRLRGFSQIPFPKNGNPGVILTVQASGREADSRLKRPASPAAGKLAAGKPEPPAAWRPAVDRASRRGGPCQCHPGAWCRKKWGRPWLCLLTSPRNRDAISPVSEPEPVLHSHHAIFTIMIMVVAPTEINR